MKKMKYFLLACLMVVSLCAYPVSAALPETVDPLWNNTHDVALNHGNVGTTAHCYVDISIVSGAVLKNVSIFLIAMDTTDIVQRWDDPEMTVDAYNEYSFYGTVEGVIPGNTYQLALQCEVWKNGVCDSISLGCTATYTATE